MSELAIQVEGLGKQYRIEPRERYKTFRDVVADGVRAPLRGLRDRLRATPSGLAKPAAGHIWALKDVSFTVGRGEVIGVIGRNGAGKSTLLKILTRITAPTEGAVDIYGRVGSLLEVGTGFNPELTGRENIYLSGAILGMRSHEIRRKFDEIVAFADVERFLDTPVKRYSSGMQMRLAFSVAAHLEPEILLVDEVLAVGDADFQKKCIGRMTEVAGHGRTVLFVSHNMAAVLSLCSKALLLQGGRAQEYGLTDRIVGRYLTDSAHTEISLADRSDRDGAGPLRFVGVDLRDECGQRVVAAQAGRDLAIVLHYVTDEEAGARRVDVALGIHGRFDENLFHLSTDVTASQFREVPPSGTIVCHVPRLSLQPGEYSVNLYCTVGQTVSDWIQGAFRIQVEPGDFFSTGKLPPIEQGPVLVAHHWRLGPAREQA